MPAKSPIKTLSIDTILTACADKAHASKVRMSKVAMLVQLEDGEYRLVTAVNGGTINGLPAVILYAGTPIEEE